MVMRIKSEPGSPNIAVYTEDVEIYQALRKRPDLVLERLYDDSKLHEEGDLRWVSAELIFPWRANGDIVEQINRIRPSPKYKRHR